MRPVTEKAIETVKQNNKQFYLHALSFAREWVKNRFVKFSSEDLRDSYYKLNPKPREERIWGAVINALKKEGLIRFHSYQQYKNPAGHSRPSAVWISYDYSVKQKKNRQSNGRTQISLF